MDNEQAYFEQFKGDTKTFEETIQEGAAAIVKLGALFKDYFDKNPDSDLIGFVGA